MGQLDASIVTLTFRPMERDFHAFSRTDRFDCQGAALLGIATTGLLLGLSAVAGLSVPGWATATLFAVAAAAAGMFARWEFGAPFPVSPPRCRATPDWRSRCSVRWLVTWCSSGPWC